MTKDECMRRQIEATLKIEKKYVKNFSDLLKSTNISEENRSITEELRQASLDAVSRLKQLKLKYV